MRYLLLRLTILLSLITLVFVVYTNLSLTKKITSLQDTISLLQSEQLAYSINQNKLLTEQGITVQSVQNELSKTKKDALVATTKLSSIEADFSKEKNRAANTVITSTDINRLLNAVNQVVCKETGRVSSGSGSLWKISTNSSPIILTNRHVVQDGTNCVVVVSSKDSESIGVYDLNGAPLTYNKNTDTAAITIGKGVSTSPPLLSSYNYALSSLRRCPSNISVGSPVVIIGFPAYARRDTEVTLPTIGTVKTIYRTVTNGIVSGYDTSDVAPKGALKEPNFFISAKIDSGNSGGIAIAKDADGLCVLGLPTWLTVGSYETQGLVQNIRNVLP